MAVRFIRKNGRIIPISGGRASDRAYGAVAGTGLATAALYTGKKAKEHWKKGGVEQKTGLVMAATAIPGAIALAPEAFRKKAVGGYMAGLAIGGAINYGVGYGMGWAYKKATK